MTKEFVIDEAVNEQCREVVAAAMANSNFPEGVTIYDERILPEDPTMPFVTVTYLQEVLSTLTAYRKGALKCVTLCDDPEELGRRLRYRSG